MLEVRLNYSFPNGSLLSNDACPSYARFLQKELKSLCADGVGVVDVPSEMWDIHDVAWIENAANKRVASIEAHGQGWAAGASALLCSADEGSLEWLAATEKGETAMECPVCMEEYGDNGVERAGPLVWPVPSVCRHWACVRCWQEISGRSDRRCPVCREDVSSALAQVFPESACAKDFERSAALLARLVADTDCVWRAPQQARRRSDLFSVSDVLHALCVVPVLKEELERHEPVLQASTEYLERRQQPSFFPHRRGMVGVAPAHIILSALSRLDPEVLCPTVRFALLSPDSNGAESGFIAWSALSSLIFAQEVYSLFRDEVRRSSFGAIMPSGMGGDGYPGGDDAAESDEDDNY